MWFRGIFQLKEEEGVSSGGRVSNDRSLLVSCMCPGKTGTLDRQSGRRVQHLVPHQIHTKQQEARCFTVKRKFAPRF